MVHLNRSIEQAWRRTVEEAATVSGTVVELSRITAQVALEAEMGDTALAMLERVLAGEFEGYEAWERSEGGQYRRDLGDVVVIYNPVTHQLSIEAQLAETLSAEARAAAEASGFTVGEVAVEAMGSYYDDNWGGRTKEKALQDAQSHAEHKLAAAIESLHREQHQEEFKKAESEARMKAESQARETLERLQGEVREAMRQRLRVTMADAEERVHQLMHRAVGHAYRQTLLQLVRDNGGRVLSDVNTGSVINMELELF
jgi:flagellar biosynthesis/type III secretory pathway protein FliH